MRSLCNHCSYRFPTHQRSPLDGQKHDSRYGIFRMETHTKPTDRLRRNMGGGERRRAKAFAYWLLRRTRTSNKQQLKGRLPFNPLLSRSQGSCSILDFAIRLTPHPNNLYKNTAMRCFFYCNSMCITVSVETSFKI